MVAGGGGAVILPTEWMRKLKEGITTHSAKIVSRARHNHPGTRASQALTILTCIFWVPCSMQMHTNVGLDKRFGNAPTNVHDHYWYVTNLLVNSSPNSGGLQQEDGQAALLTWRTGVTCSGVLPRCPARPEPGRVAKQPVNAAV